MQVRDWNSVIPAFADFVTNLSGSQKSLFALVDAIGFGALPVAPRQSWPTNGIRIGNGSADPELARLFAALCAHGNKFAGAATLGIKDQMGFLAMDLNSNDFRRSISNGPLAWGNKDPAWPSVLSAALQFYNYSGPGSVDWQRVDPNAVSVLEAFLREGQSNVSLFVVVFGLAAAWFLFGGRRG